MHTMLVIVSHFVGLMSRRINCRFDSDFFAEAWLNSGSIFAFCEIN